MGELAGRLVMMISIAAFLPLASAAVAAQSGGGAVNKTRFAVVADGPASGDSSEDWLARGVAFDLEKRLGRLPSLDPADRLDVAAAWERVAAGGDASRVGAVMDRTGADLVLRASASDVRGSVSLRVDLWSRGKHAASLSRKGAMRDLFRLIDDLIDEIVPALGKVGIDVGKTENMPGLKWHPCLSMAAYEELIIGMVLLQKGDTAQAKARLQASLSAERDNWFARYFLGAVALREGNIAKAIGYCREAIDLNPDVYSGVYANLSYCCSATGDGKQAQWAKTEFERRTGRSLPARSVPGAMPFGSFGGRP